MSRRRTRRMWQGTSIWGIIWAPAKKRRNMPDIVRWLPMATTVVIMP